MHLKAHVWVMLVASLLSGETTHLKHLQKRKNAILELVTVFDTHSPSRPSSGQQQIKTHATSNH